jgi:hypothetical protein
MARASAERFPSVDAFVTALSAAAQTTSDAALPETQEPLPPLAGEATRITNSGDTTAAAEDADDPIAPPPSDVGLKGPTLEMPTVPVPEEATGEQPAPTLPPVRTLVVERMSPRSPGTPGTPPQPLEEPRVTLKTMNAVTEGSWDRVAVDATRQSPLMNPRARWIAVGALLGLALAMVFVLLFLR